MTEHFIPSKDASRRNDSVLSRASSVASYCTQDGGSEGSSKGWKPSSWRLSRSAKSGRASSSLSRNPSSSTTSSRYSASTKSSISVASLKPRKDSQPPTTETSSSGSVQAPFDSVSDATLALQSLTTTVPEVEEEDEISPAPVSERNPPAKDKTLPPVPKRSESRARSTRSKLSAISSKDSTAGLAEIEMVGREYQGYWRATFTARLPPAAALCGSMLLTARLPAHKGGFTTISVNSESLEWAESLCGRLEEAETPEEAVQVLQRSSFETTVLALRASFDSGGMPTVPDKTAWAMYQRIAEVKNHPDKLNDLWGHISKLLRKIPEDTMCVIMFFLTVARRLQSRGVTIEDRAPAVFLLRDFFPRYVGEDMAKLLLKYYEHIPHDLPLILEAVNYKLGSRRCNVLALVASKKPAPATPTGGVKEIRVSEERQPAW